MTVVGSPIHTMEFDMERFQSLLLWMTVVGSSRSSFGSGISSDVSILVVVDDGRRLGLTDSYQELAHGFQSLLLWMTVVGPEWISATSSFLSIVSILVVVDDGRRPR